MGTVPAVSVRDKRSSDRDHSAFRGLANRAPRSLEYRSKLEQLPQDQGGKAVAAIHSYFRKDSHSFEYCAATIAKMMLPDVTSLDVSRPCRGGRDAIGQLQATRLLAKHRHYTSKTAGHS